MKNNDWVYGICLVLVILGLFIKGEFGVLCIIMLFVFICKLISDFHGMN